MPLIPKRQPPLYIPAAFAAWYVTEVAYLQKPGRHLNTCTPVTVSIEIELTPINYTVFHLHS